MRKELLYTGILFCMYSCQVRKNTNIHYSKVETQIEEYPDSSYFSEISNIIYDNSKLYILDSKRGDIVELSDDFKTMNYVSHHGEAPYETIMPLTFNVLNDTVFVVDFGTRSMKKFHEGTFCGNFSLSNAAENRFVINDSLLFLPATTDSTSFLRIPIYHPEEQSTMGKVVKGETDSRTIITNGKHLLYDKKEYIYSVAESYPYIEKYNLDGEFISVFDISSIPIIKEAIEYARSFANEERTVYVYIRDAYLQNDKIYLLCCSSGNNQAYKANTIIELSIDNNMEHTCTYILPHEVYSSFCVSDSYLFAAQSARSTAIEKIKLSDNEVPNMDNIFNEDCKVPDT